MKPCWDAIDRGSEDVANKGGLKGLGLDEELGAWTGKQDKGVEDGESTLQEGPLVTLERRGFPTVGMSWFLQQSRAQLE